MHIPDHSKNLTVNTKIMVNKKYIYLCRGCAMLVLTAMLGAVYIQCMVLLCCFFIPKKA